MILHEVARSYCLELSLEDYIVVDADDSYKGDGVLYAKLTEIDELYDIDFSGHFGPHIYYSVWDEDDTPELHEKVKTTIQETIAELRGKA